MTTKEKIMQVSLDLFSVKGYDPVSVRDIAHAVGIKESSIYNHFRSKQDIFDSILNEYSNHWNTVFGNIQMDKGNTGFTIDHSTMPMDSCITQELFKNISEKIFNYFMTDETNIKFRKMLTIEQYRSDRLQNLFRRISFDDSIDFHTHLFGMLMEAGSFIKTDPYILSVEFFSPIFLIFYKYGNDAESLEKAKDLFSRHIDHFYGTYRTT